jgi:uncharacterized protein
MPVLAALTETSWPANTVHWVGRYGGLLKSAATEVELIMMLERPRLAARVAPFFLEGLHRILTSAEAVAMTERIAVCRDPADDKLLELAVNGKADAIITGDLGLLALDTFREIPIITPAAFGRTRTRPG